MKRLIFIMIAACASAAALHSCSDDTPQPVSFNSSVVQPADSFLDVRDSNVYRTVRIGNQIWLAENLRYALPGYSLDGAYTWGETEIDKTKITPDKELIKTIVLNIAHDPQYGGWNDTLPNGLIFSRVTMIESLVGRLDHPSRPITVADLLATIEGILPKFQKVLSPKLLAYADLPEVKAIEGKKSFLAAESKNGGYVAQYGFLYSHAGALAAVPDGWRLPTDEDWKTLERTLGLSADEANKLNAWRGLGLSTALNEGGASQFNATNAGANIYQIEATQNYYNKDKAWYYWTATSYMREDSTMVAYYRQSSSFNTQVWRGTSPLTNKRRPVLYSVRLVKDI